MLKNRSWYNGWFYALFIDNRGSALRRKIVKSIENGKTVYDWGCGTAGLALDLTSKSDHVLGIDISARQIDVARKRKKKTGYVIKNEKIDRAGVIRMVIAETQI